MEPKEVRFLMSQDLHDQISRLAQAKGTSSEAVIIEACRLYLARFGSATPAGDAAPDDDHSEVELRRFHI